MIYPKFVNDNDSIGVTAPSDGEYKDTDIKSFEYAKKELKEKYNLNVQFTDNVFRSDGTGRSSTAFERSFQLSELFKDKNINFIHSATGGSYLCEILDFFDFDIVKNNPKWFMGYSDNTWLSYLITTNVDIATIYGPNFGIFGTDNYELPQEYCLDLIRGKSLKYESFKRYQSQFRNDIVTGLESYNYDSDVCWKTNTPLDKVHFEGRLLGGCTDIIFSLIGTKYDNTLNFIKKYQKDGIVFFFETFASSSDDLYLHLWQLKNASWFKHVRGIIFGRPCFYNSYENLDYKDVVMSVLGGLNIPMVFDACIGHRGPSIPLINGSYCVIEADNGKGSIEFILK